MVAARFVHRFRKVCSVLVVCLPWHRPFEKLKDTHTLTWFAYCCCYFCCFTAEVTKLSDVAATGNPSWPTSRYFVSHYYYNFSGHFFTCLFAYFVSPKIFSLLVGQRVLGFWLELLFSYSFSFPFEVITSSLPLSTLFFGRLEVVCVCGCQWAIDGRLSVSVCVCVFAWTTVLLRGARLLLLDQGCCCSVASVHTIALACFLAS